MNTEKKELAVAALRSGTVIDHIPADVLFEVARLLQIENSDVQLTIGNNLPSRRLGRKGIIKVADTTFPEAVLNRIALLAPEANVNVIENYEVVDKHRVELPDTLVNVVKCNNPKCITNNEPMATRFIVIDRNPVKIRCSYCGHTRQ
ncbi:MAG: aspartate carbamoyltransferase regulatory subunit [Muribaculaceae bacterium]|nr:aspartate carbamoyltransferase regulatory subunit [Muribaculaceae bacterium]